MFETYLVQPIYNIFIALVGVVPHGDTGLAIIALTIIMRLVLYPVFTASIRTQMGMTDMQGDIELIFWNTKPAYPASYLFGALGRRQPILGDIPDHQPHPYRTKGPGQGRRGAHAAKHDALFYARGYGRHFLLFCRGSRIIFYRQQPFFGRAGVDYKEPVQKTTSTINTTGTIPEHVFCRVVLVVFIVFIVW